MVAYVGQIRWVAFDRVPGGWARCDGQLLNIAEHEVLYTLIGTTYGGDGQTKFALPDLRGRVPMSAGARPGGSTYVLGQALGTEEVTLSTTHLPHHTHAIPVAERSAVTGNPGLASGGGTFARGGRAYASENTAQAQFHPSALSTAGRTEPHSNMQPYLTMNAIIALVGVFPSQS